jgi:ribosomal protein S18 acetylase RimI-like enzyme
MMFKNNRGIPGDLRKEEKVNPITYISNELLDAQEVSDLFYRSGIRRPIGDLERIQRMLVHADEMVSARDNGKLVGLIRAITDYSYSCYISDLAVDKSCQGNGIGKELINQLIYKLGNEEIQYVLTSAPNASGFYEHIGFERADKAFVLKRLKNV